MVQIICVFFFCIGFGILFHIRGWNLFLGAIGGCLAWLTYLLTDSIGRTDIIAYFCGTVVMTLYAEIAAYYRKVPVSVFLGVEMIPLVPGKIFFYTMVNLFFGYERFVYEKGVYALQIAGVIAIGIFLTSTVVRMYLRMRKTAKTWIRSLVDKEGRP